MPTTEAKARKLLKRGRAEILKYKPFTIRMLDREDGAVQPIEYKCDSVPRRHVIDGGAEVS